MKKITTSPSKTLKLTNVLMMWCQLQDEDFDFNIAIEQMQSFIRSKGAMQIGPLIQYTSSYLNEAGEVDIDIRLLLQCNNYIHSVEQPYTMESVLRIPNCMYCRYIGPEDKLKFAYDKIQLEAFENDIPLKGDSYTIFVNRDEENETITADVFMERADQ